MQFDGYIIGRLTAHAQYDAFVSPVELEQLNLTDEPMR
jgi:hypothetical protein